MLISEVCNLIGLTKKAICYYEEQKLISPKKGMNGYRIYSDKEINLLNEISLYRKLDISIKEIKNILNSPDKQDSLNKIIKEKHEKEIQVRLQKRYLETIIKSNFSDDIIKELNEEIISNEKSNGDFIRRELIRLFPQGLGIYLSYHFAPYLNEPLDTVEKYNAWIKIVEFLEQVPEIRIPKEIEKVYEGMTDEFYKQINDNMRNEINNIVNASNRELEIYKENIRQLNDDKYFLEVMSPYYEFKKQVNEFYNSSGYYETFLPNIKIISNEYREYYDKLAELNDMLSQES